MRKRYFCPYDTMVKFHVLAFQKVGKFQNLYWLQYHKLQWNFIMFKFSAVSQIWKKYIQKLNDWDLPLTLTKGGNLLLIGYDPQDLPREAIYYLLGMTLNTYQGRQSITYRVWPSTLTKGGNLLLIGMTLNTYQGRQSITYWVWPSTLTKGGNLLLIGMTLNTYQGRQSITYRVWPSTLTKGGNLCWSIWSSS